MKITVFCEILGEENNGTTIASMNLINYLIKKGHEVTVVCPDDDKKDKKGYVILPKLHLGSFIDKIIAANKVVPSKFDKELVYNAMKDADIVHITFPLFLAKKASKMAKELNKPLTASFHAQAENFTSHIFLKNNKLANHIAYLVYYNNLYIRADAIHYPTQFIKDLFEAHIHKKTNAYVISNGVNDIFKPIKIEKEDALKNKFCILFTGRFSQEKSHMVLLKAVKESKHEKDIQLIFAGDGPTKNKVIKYSKKHLTNQPIINFYSREDLVKLINQCDLYCHPSEIEIEAISCLEAICCGLVPIISNSPRSATKAFALDERSLFKVNNHKDLASKIDYFIENKDEKEKLRELYLSSSTVFNQTSCMEQMEKMIIETYNKKKEEQNNGKNL